MSKTGARPGPVLCVMTTVYLGFDSRWLHEWLHSEGRGVGQPAADFSQEFSWVIGAMIIGTVMLIFGFILWELAQWCRLMLVKKEQERERKVREGEKQGREAGQ